MKRVSTMLGVMPAFLLWAAPALAQGYRNSEYYGHDGWGWGHMIFGGLMMVAFWAGIIVLIVLAVRWLAGTSRPGTEPGRSSALEVLEERYARGELDHDEFEQRKRGLKG